MSDWWRWKLEALSVLGCKCIGPDGKGCPHNVVDPEILTFDHINGDGYVAGRRGAGFRGSGLTQDVLRKLLFNCTIKDVLQVLCWNCHRKKTLRSGEYKPHTCKGHVTPLPLFDRIIQ